MTDPLFPNFTRFAQEQGLDRARGNLAAALPRILGMGSTRAGGLSLPPSDIERKVELAKVDIPQGIVVPPEVRAEIESAAVEVAALKLELGKQDGRRRFQAACLERIEGTKGAKNNYYYAGPLVLTPGRSAMEWAWSVTPHYPVIDRLPPDPAYVAVGHRAALDAIVTLTVPPDVFGRRLQLAWTLARHFSDSDDVRVTAVMRMYQIAGQEDTFWQSPRRNVYRDLPKAAFVVNLLNWRRHSSDISDFEFVPATLHQAHGPRADVFYMPLNQEGTEVRPMVALRRAAPKAAKNVGETR